MKIGMAVNNLRISGGYQKLVLRLSEQLLKDGHDVSVYAFDVDRDRCYPEIIKNINVISLPNQNPSRQDNFFKKGVRLVIGNIVSINNARRLAQVIPRDLDALIIHDEYCLHLLNWMNKGNTRVVWMLNNQLSGNFDPALKIIGAVFKTVRGIKDLIIKIVTLPQLVISLSSLKQSVRKIDEFAVYDSFNKKLVEEKLGRNATVVFAGADLEKFKTISHERTFANKEEYILLSVGVFFPHRRHEDLIDAVYILKNQGVRVTVVLVGRHDQDVRYSNEILSKIKDLHLEKEIECRQEVSDQEMINLYNAADIFCFINNGFTWGISVFEAVAAGLPVIITNNIGAADIIQNGISGFLVNPCSPQEIATAVKKILSDDRKIDSMTRAAYATTERIVSWKSFSERMLHLIRK